MKGGAAMSNEGEFKKVIDKPAGKKDPASIFNNLGFEENPFRPTNADKEGRLEQYFISPSYFDSES